RGIPADEFTAVVRCDPKRAGLLYAGTDRTVYASFDDGDTWQPLSLNLPTTWYRDLLVHDDDLIAATQGRGIWVLDDVTPLRELAAGAAEEAVHLVTPSPAVRLRASESHDTPWPPETPLGENPPAGAMLDYWLDRPAGGGVTLTVRNRAGDTVRRFSSEDRPESLVTHPYFETAWLGTARTLSVTAGMHRFVWDLRETRPAAPEYGYSIAAVRTQGTPVEPEGPLVPPGAYTVTLAANGTTITRPLTVRLDPRVRVTQRDLQQQYDETRAAISVLERGVATLREIGRVQSTHARSLPAAMVDSIAFLTGPADASLRTTTHRVSGLVGDLESADGAPTGAQRLFLDDCRLLMDGLVARWRMLATTIPAADRR
ncbi:MAG TPA: hypothetical protein VLV15_06670, partial [Dongiaceae bacterium]|nr:hypothetical protein [Dongiaceae bacterium]